jgi:hypothetical protein
MTPLRALALALLLPAPAFAQKAPAKPSDAVVKAWEKAGFRSGWYGRNKGGLDAFHAHSFDLAGPMPAFHGTSKQLDRLAEMPDAKVPFALDLGYAKVTDAGVKELKAALPKCKVAK